MNWRKSVAGLLGISVSAIALAVLWRQLQHVSFTQLQSALHATSAASISMALFCTALSFCCLAAYEVFATRQVVPGKVPLAAALRVGFLGHAIANTLGFHWLTGGAVRYQAYQRLGLRAVEVASVFALVSACVGLGMVAITVAALLWLQSSAGGMSRMLLPVSGLFLVTLVLVLQRPARMRFPSLPLVLRRAGQLSMVGLVEMAAAVLALWVLLPEAARPALAPFVLLVVAVSMLGIASHSPGGLGVFEAGILAGTPGGHEAAVLLSLLLYRAIYNLLPFSLAALLYLGTARASQLEGG